MPPVVCQKALGFADEFFFLFYQASALSGSVATADQVRSTFFTQTSRPPSVWRFEMEQARYLKSKTYFLNADGCHMSSGNLV